LAVAILANYAVVVLHGLRESVWIGDWGKAVVDDAVRILPEDWHGCIAWEVEQTHANETTIEFAATQGDEDELETVASKFSSSIVTVS
jgi:hypothetical protein